METQDAISRHANEPKWLIDGVPSASVPDLWPTVWPIIKRAVDTAPHGVRFKEERLLDLLVSREMQLWIIVKVPQGRIAAVVMTSIIDIDRYIPEAIALEVPFIGATACGTG